VTTPETRISANRPDVIDEVFDGEAVLINLRLGRYYALDARATEVWRMVCSGAAFEDVVAARADEDVRTFLARLVEEDLVVLEGGPLPAAPAANGHPVPGLEVFTDLEDLLLLDPIHDVDPGTGWPQQQSPAAT
jgi:hypothetical protein